MILLAGGDSFIFGSELADQKNGIASKSVMPALLANSINADYICSANPGNSNAAIARQVMNQCELNKGSDLFVFVMWTFTHRYEFRFNYDTKRRDTPWYSINLWDIVEDPAALKAEFHNFDEKIFKSHLKNKQSMDSTGLTDFAKTFYMHVGNSEFYECYSSYKEIVFLQQYLTANKIPFMFAPADNYFKEHPNYTRHQHDVSITSLYNQIDWDKWFIFPKGIGSDQTEVPRGFYQWAVENKYPVGTTHPLEQAHYDAAELMKDKFNELVKKSI
jgi:hypothetical protein